MRTLKRNKEIMKYALLICEQPVYELDENGNRIVDYIKDGQNVYVQTGEKILVYTTPKVITANKSMSGSDAEAREYGLSTADYEAIINYPKGEYPIVEGALIWCKSNVEYRGNGEEIEVVDKNGKTVKTKNPNPHSADYKVIKISSKNNEEKAILKAENK